MTDTLLYIAIGVPMLFNALLITILIGYVNAKFEGVNNRFQDLYQRLEAINQRFDDMRDLWRAELYRVEGVIDARLKHLEEN